VPVRYAGGAPYAGGPVDGARAASSGWPVTGSDAALWLWAPTHVRPTSRPDPETVRALQALGYAG